MLVSVVARGEVEPPTFRFSVPSPPDRSRTTWHFACRGYLGEAPEVPRKLELLDSLLDTHPTTGCGYAAPWFHRLDGANTLVSSFPCEPWVRSYGVVAAPGVATTRPAAWAALVSRWS
jgi:hypothetical protein